MPDMGYRDNVMGPQPIMARRPIPQDLLDAVTQILDLLASGKASEANATAVESAKEEIAKVAASIKPGIYNDKKIVATARTNDHYWIKVKLIGADAKPTILQLRMGPDGNKWSIWQVTNLSDARSAWTK